MKSTLLVCYLIMISCIAKIQAQEIPTIDITFSKLYATYDFVEKLANPYYEHPYRTLFNSSAFNTKEYVNLLEKYHKLNIYETYEFQNYPKDQKVPGITLHILRKFLIVNENLIDFKQDVFGIIPSEDLHAFVLILEKFEPVFDQLIYSENKDLFKKKIDDLISYFSNIEVAQYFEVGLKFYDSYWDPNISFDIAIVPSINKNGFTATAFLNNAVSELSLNFDSFDILASVMLHEIYHVQYDCRKVEQMMLLKEWFDSSQSIHSQYAYLLLNEVLATALGNGYVFKKLNNKLDEEDWYNVPYINLLAKEIYSVVEDYIQKGKPIDKEFVDLYIKAYETKFPQWNKELNHLFTYLYIISENPSDFDFYYQNYPYRSIGNMSDEFTSNGLVEMKERAITKVLLISDNNHKKLQLVKDNWPELSNWNFSFLDEFVKVFDLEDKTKLIIVNAIESKPNDLFLKEFPDGILK